MADKRVYSFVEKKYSSNGIASLVLSAISIVLFLMLLLISYWLKGSAGTWIGACGVTGIVMALLGLRYGFVSFRDDCKSNLPGKAGMILSTVAIVGWFFIVCVGIVSMM
ncbi:MAG: DUF6142 family protein [Lachnospiraceae bacterium]|nr:DUF6142 family protein [Lachnospiraceae bacterium]